MACCLMTLDTQQTFDVRPSFLFLCFSNWSCASLAVFEMHHFVFLLVRSHPSSDARNLYQGIVKDSPSATTYRQTYTRYSRKARILFLNPGIILDFINRQQSETRSAETDGWIGVGGLTFISLEKERISEYSSFLQPRFQQNK